MTADPERSPQNQVTVIGQDYSHPDCRYQKEGCSPIYGIMLDVFYGNHRTVKNASYLCNMVCEGRRPISDYERRVLGLGDEVKDICNITQHIFEDPTADIHDPLA